MTLNGTLLDSKTNEPMLFGAVQVTDSNGKPVGNNGTSTDDKGKYTLKNVKPTDYITTSYIGYAPKTVAVNSAIVKEGGIGNLDIKIDQTGITLSTVEVTAEKPKTKIKTSGAVQVEKKPEQKAKEPVKLWVKIALGVGAVTIFGIIIFLATKDNKSTK
jgi:hypothetical protein